jgi:Heavy metal associated domain 2
VISVVHRLPGRIRVQCPGLVGRPSAALRMEEGVRALKGVGEVAANPVTGSVLAFYDPQAQEEGAVVGRMLRIAETTGIQGTERPAPPGRRPERTMVMPHLARAVQDPFDRINTGVFRMTEGYLDLRYLVPLLFLGFGTVRLLRQGPVPAIPWYLFYWWAYRVFLAADGRRGEAVPARV